MLILLAVVAGWLLLSVVTAAFCSALGRAARRRGVRRWRPAPRAGRVVTCRRAAVAQRRPL